MSRLYVLLRSDLHKNYQSVQAGHAVAAFMMDYPGEWNNQTLIYLRVKDEDELAAWNQRVAERGCKFACFQEPDLDDQLTAMAILSDTSIENMLSLMKLV